MGDCEGLSNRRGLLSEACHPETRGRVCRQTRAMSNLQPVSDEKWLCPTLEEG
ncbi:MAG: hypothetical protein IKR05_08370 [Prevotella sp.]|nr:hypothetical protein [Prevotella sp.]